MSTTHTKRAQQRRARPGRLWAGDIVRALLAAALLAVLLLGPPLLLWRMAPLLLPSHLPTAADLSAALLAPDDGTLFLRALALVGTGAWVTFLIAVGAEAVAQVRGVQLPALPLLSAQQRTAGGLVAAVAVLFAAPVAVAAPPQVVAAAAAPPAAATSPSAPSASATAASALPASVQVRVHQGDTLWGIAQHQLGDGAAYPELVEATRDVVQPDGRRLRDADQIYPGWLVVVPQHGAAASGLTAPVPSATSRATTPAPASSASGAGAPATPKVESTPTSAATTPASTDTASTAISNGAPTTGSDEEHDVEFEDDEPVTPWELGAGLALSGLTAAGIVSLLRRRRSRQQRHRRSGQRLPVAAPEVQITQRRVHAVQDPLTVAQLDLVLRALGAQCATSGTPVPVVNAVRLTSERIELHLAVPSLPVAPFHRSGVPESTWYVDRDALPESVPASVSGAGSLTPFPALVSMGRDLDGALVLVDVEAVTELAVAAAPRNVEEGAASDTSGAAGERAAQHSAAVNDGADDGVGDVEAVLSAAVIDLATSPWAAEADVTVLGSLGPLVTALDVDHVRHVDLGDTHRVERVFSQLETWSSDVRRFMLRHPDDGPAAVRVHDEQADALRPHVLVLTSPLAAEHHARLHNLLSVASHVPIAVLTANRVGEAAWSLTLERRTALASLSPMGLRLHPQQLGADARRLLTAAVEVASAGPEAFTQALSAAGTSDAAAPASVPAPTSSSSVDRDAAGDSAFPSAPYGGVPSERDGVHVVSTAVCDVVGTPSTDEPAADFQAEGSTGVGVDLGAAASPQPSSLLRVGLLGPVVVLDPQGDPAPSNQLAGMVELVAFLALHPHRSHHLLDEALWPGDRVPRTRRNQLISRTRRWLGRDAEDCAYLPLTGTEGYRLAPSVRTDWADLQGMVGRSLESASTADLTAALDLVRGQPFAGTNTRRYGWADVDKQEMIEKVTDVAREVAHRALRDGDAPLARRAAAIGLMAEPGCEQLWRDALNAERLAGNRPALEALADRFTAMTQEWGEDPEEETRELIARLLPRHSRSRARHRDEHHVEQGAEDHAL